MIDWCGNFAYMVAQALAGKEIHKLTENEQDVVAILEEIGFLMKAKNGFVGNVIDDEEMNRFYDVFLGGTCNDSKWRDKLMPLLDESGVVYFNPVVDDWTEQSIDIENEAKQNSIVQLYTITPKMKGVYSIAEVIDASYSDKQTFFVIYEDDDEGYFDDGEMRSLIAVGKMVVKNGGIFIRTRKIESIASFLNEFLGEKNEN